MEDWIISDELKLHMSRIGSGAAALAMIFGGAIPYIPQYLQIKQTQDADGFSLLVCLTLLVANTLRILFWFYSKFELPLLVQSLVMNGTMFLMIHLCVTVRRNNSILKGRDRVFTDFDPKYFWQWTDFQSYLDFMLALWLVGAIITYFMLPFKEFMETVGFFAVFIEAMLGAPQFLRNFKNKSTQGMSIMMVLLWTVGDMFKTGYFIIRNAPNQFWICGTLQVSLDLAILLQVLLYRKNTEPQNMHRGD
ncbi:solute carrier family 66 member 2 isoform X2 [Contarinia nasturtii]|uniref:solute carrier family 66 member 2 isoform X2 n=1 Tax=Contarinia nasturtii TaxID=265458 RepID=UPI0012D377C3|nr:solute carrier family 66 member 2 isoform X2 [Contarinia nasturtii]